MANAGDDRELRLFEEIKPKYDELRRDFETDEQYIRGEYGQDVIPSDWADDNIDPVRLPTITDAIDNAADHLLTDPKISVNQRPVTKNIEKQKDIAENKRAFLEMWWNRIFEDQGDPLGRGKKSLIKGKLVLKLELDWANLPTLPEKPTDNEKSKYRRDLERIGKSRFLWKLRVLPKETVYEDLYTPWDPPYVFEAYSITVGEAKHRWPKLAEARGDDGRFRKSLAQRDDWERVEYKEYWTKPAGDDPGKFIQWIEDERVHESENPYSWLLGENSDGRTPYIIGDPGFGDVDADAKPFDRYKSLARDIRSLALAETRQMTAFEAALRMYVWKPIITKNMPEIEEGEKTLDVGPGAIWNIEEDQEIDVMQFGEPIPASMNQFLTRIQGEADRHSKFGALGGTAQRGVDTAQEADQNVRNAAAKLSGPVRTLVRMIKQINSYVFSDIENVLEAPVTIYGATNHGLSEVTLMPSEIDGFWYTGVELQTSDEAAISLRDARLWSDMAQQMKISNRTAMEKAGIANPQGEMDEWMIEQLESSPQALQLQIMLMLQSFSDTDAGKAVLASFQQSLAQPAPAGGAAGGGGPSPTQIPPAPNNVEQLRQDAQQQAVQTAPERSFQ